MNCNTTHYRANSSSVPGDPTNVDPGQPQLKWGDTYRTDHERLCHAFGADVRLIPSTLGEARLPSGETDVLLCVSVLEHLPAGAVTEFAQHASRILRPGGLAVLSVDLFLNLAPFSQRTDNRWGRNIDIRDLLEASGLELIKGDREVLNGFPEFQAERVLERLDGYLLAPNYPCLAQCFVARRPVTAS